MTTVQQLIDALDEVDDKELPVALSSDEEGNSFGGAELSFGKVRLGSYDDDPADHLVLWPSGYLEPYGDDEDDIW